MIRTYERHENLLNFYHFGEEYHCQVYISYISEHCDIEPLFGVIITDNIGPLPEEKAFILYSVVYDIAGAALVEIGDNKDRIKEKQNMEFVLEHLNVAVQSESYYTWRLNGGYLP